MAKACHHPTRTIRRTLEDLTALRLVERMKAGAGQDGRGNPDYWRLADDARERLIRAMGKTVPEMSVGGKTDEGEGATSVPETSVPMYTPSPISSSPLNTPTPSHTYFSGTNNEEGQVSNGDPEEGQIVNGNKGLGPVTIDCSHQETHGEHHRPHPTTGRIVCWECHPPPVEVEQ